MKKKFSLVISLLLILSLVTPVFAADEQEVTVYVDGDLIEFADNHPIIEKGTTLVPVRPFFGALGLEVDWDDDTWTVTGHSDLFTIAIDVGQDVALINGQEVVLPATPRIINGVTYVPLRFISELYGYEVEWEGDTQTIYITSFGSKGFLWKTEYGDNHVYLLGSIHIGNEEMYPLHSSIIDALYDSDYLVVEVDLTELDEEYGEMIQQLGMYQDGTTLRDNISEDTYNKLEAVLEEYYIPIEFMEEFKPWFIENMLAMLILEEAGYSADYGIDINLMLLALALDIPILELESMEFQMSLMAEYSADRQEQILLSLLEEYDQAEEIIRELVDMWKDGDEDQLLAIILSDEEWPEEEHIMHDRNLNMFEQVEAFLSDEDTALTYLVVVGAAHMLGETGLVTLLLENGYEVERQ